MYNFGSFDAFIVKPTIMPDFARNLLHYKDTLEFYTVALTTALQQNLDTGLGKSMAVSSSLGLQEINWHRKRKPDNPTKRWWEC